MLALVIQLEFLGAFLFLPVELRFLVSLESKAELVFLQVHSLFLRLILLVFFLRDGFLELLEPFPKALIFFLFGLLVI